MQKNNNIKIKNLLGPLKFAFANIRTDRLEVFALLFLLSFFFLQIFYFCFYFIFLQKKKAANFGSGEKRIWGKRSKKDPFGHSEYFLKVLPGCKETQKACGMRFDFNPGCLHVGMGNLGSWW